MTSTYELPDAQVLSDLAQDGDYGFRKGSLRELLLWIVQAKAELDFLREKCEEYE